MELNGWVRRGHRWLSMVFTLSAATVFLALGLGAEPAPWVYFAPLAPLALLALSGLWMFFLPYVFRRRGGSALSMEGGR